MELQINENKLRLSGVVNIPKSLELDKSYDLLIKNAEVKNSQDCSNDDGTYNKIWKMKLSEMSELEIINEKGQVMKGRKKQTQSQKLRFLIWLEADEKGADRDIYYQQEMGKIIEQRK